MNKKIIIFTAIAGMVYIGTTSYHGGAAADGALNRTGAKGSTANCAGAGCHTGVSPASSAIIYIDSTGGIPVTKYTPGKTYTIRVVGKHSVNNEFGFQFAAVSGAGSAQVQAGVFGASLPSDVVKTTLSGLDLIEHTGHIAAAGSADSFVRSFTWTAPATSVGNISLYLSVNAVNGNHMPDVSDVSSNVSKVLPPYTSTTGSEAIAYIIDIAAFPNPMVNSLSIRISGVSGKCAVMVTDLTGALMISTTIEANSLTGGTILNTADWAPGIYQIVVENNNSRNTLQVVKG